MKRRKRKKVSKPRSLRFRNKDDIMTDIKGLRLQCQLPDKVWAYFDTQLGQLFCPLGDQPSQPFTTYMYREAIGKVEQVLEQAELARGVKTLTMPNHFAVCFRTRELAEKFREFTGIDTRWATAKCDTETLMTDVAGNVPFLAYVNEYASEATTEAGFGWGACHFVPLPVENSPQAHSAPCNEVHEVKHVFVSDESHFGNAAHAGALPTTRFHGKVYVQPGLKLTQEIASVIAAMLEIPRTHNAEGTRTQVFRTTVGDLHLVGYWTVENGEERIYISSEIP